MVCFCVYPVVCSGPTSVKCTMSMSKLPGKGEGNDENESERDDQTVTIDPRQWSDGVRRGATITMGFFAFLEPFASSMIAPSLPIIAEDFGITSSVERNVSARTLKISSISGADCELR
jgi:hypothetical protein